MSAYHPRTSCPVPLIINLTPVRKANLTPFRTSLTLDAATTYAGYPFAEQGASGLGRQVSSL